MSFKMAPWVVADLLLLSAAALWGGGFVAQRLGMSTMGPLAFGGVRFLLGALALSPLILFRYRSAFSRLAFRDGVILGSALFAAATCQQVGLVHTTAGKGGFLTGLYVVIVPLLTLFWKSASNAPRHISTDLFTAAVAFFGIYLLSIEPGTFELAAGDSWVLVGALLWAIHILLLERFTKKHEPVALAWLQFVVCGALSLLLALPLEPGPLTGMAESWGPLLYGGVVSVGIAYTFQVMGQKNAPPVHASILLSLEAVFAALAGGLFLDETLSPRALLGGALLIGAAIVSQLAQGINQSTD